MRLFTVIWALFIIIVGCNKTVETLPKLQINEISFYEDIPNLLEYIEIYNPNNFDIQIDTLYVLINHKKHFITDFKTIPSKQMIFKKLDININNKLDTIILNLNTKSVDVFKWEHTKNYLSIGRFPDGSKLISGMTSRSMGKTNDASILKLPKPKFNFNSGFYSDQINLKIDSSLTNIPLYFTTDGSKPTKNSILYQDSIIISKNSVINARFIVDNFQSPISRLSFFINEEPTLPLISIIVDSNALWNDTTGIMKKGLGAEDKHPKKGANYWKNIKLPAYGEYFNQNKDLILSEKMKIKIHGNYSRVEPIKSIRLIANNKNKEFIFKPFKFKATNRFSELILRNSGQDALKTHFIDAFIHNYAGEFLNVDFQAAQPILTFINGEYYGILNMRERYNNAYLEFHYGNSNNYSLLKAWGVSIIGDNKPYVELREKIEDIFNNPNNYNTQDIQNIIKYFDVKNWIDYFIIETYAANIDWFPNNSVFWSSSLHDEWRYLLIDFDASLDAKKKELYKHNMFDFLTNECQNKEFVVFMKNLNFRNKFITRYMDLLNTFLSSLNISQAASEYQHKITPEIPRLFRKYLPKDTIEKYKLIDDNSIVLKWQEDHLKPLYNFFQERPKYIKSQLKEHFKIGGLHTITIQSKNPYRLNSLELNQDFKGEYFTGMKYEIEVNQKKSPKFSHFLINGKPVYDKKYTFEMNSDLTIEIITE